MTLLDAAVIVTAALAAAVLGRRLAGLARQPAMVGEIVLCLLLGAVLTASSLHLLDSGNPVVRTVGHAGLALFVTGAVHGMRTEGARPVGRAVVALALGSVLLPMAAGVGVAAWVLGSGDLALRGDSPAPALMLMLAVALSVTAVPVLAGILQDHGLERTLTGRLSLTAAVTIDAVTWPLLAVAVALAEGGGGPLRTAAVLGGGAVVALAARRAATAPAVRRAAVRHPGVAVVIAAALSIAAATTTQKLGCTDVFGAALVGLALPADGPFERVGQTVGAAGRRTLPVYFVITGGTFLTGAGVGIPWTAIVVVTVAAMAAKLIGSYAGARAGALPRPVALRLATLMNTRGLTELVVLQAGLTSGVLTPRLYLALVVMALVTTVLSGPLLRAVGGPPPTPPTRVGRATPAVVGDERTW
ncbi:cation:proton antiporter [Streptomyces sp. NPDC005876]|uniref:cation:proton antiporter n=1 Tax=Streptomyces sp. NPDC005876 TaxID=3157076 RepID=UPI0033DC557D